MKNSYYIICVIIIVFTTLIGCAGNNKNTWKDTNKTFGDGTYQVFNHKENGILIQGISNSKYHQCIVDKIINMSEKENYIYVYGEFTEHIVYVIINSLDNHTKYFVEIQEDDVLGMTNINDLINSGEFELLNSYDGFTEEDKRIFAKLKNK